MSFSQEALWDLDSYRAPSSVIPDLLGHPVNQRLRVTEYYRLCPSSRFGQAYEISSESGISRDRGTVKSDDSYDEMFTQWRAIRLNPADPPEGFLCGFPYLNTPNGRVLMMHVHALWDDINTSSLAIPIHETAEVYRYSDELARAIVDQHDLASYGNFCKDRDELERELGRLVSMPMQVYGNDMQGSNPFRPAQFMLK